MVWEKGVECVFNLYLGVSVYPHSSYMSLFPVLLSLIASFPPSHLSFLRILITMRIDNFPVSWFGIMKSSVDEISLPFSVFIFLISLQQVLSHPFARFEQRKRKIHIFPSCWFTEILPAVSNSPLSPDSDVKIIMKQIWWLWDDFLILTFII